MAEYFLSLSAETFLQQIRPALSDSWRKQSFNSCRTLCNTVLPAALAYTQRYHLGAEQTLVAKIVEGIPFDRAYWRLLVGEVLLFTALEIPEFPSNSETMRCLLAGASSARSERGRKDLAPIEQALGGSQDVTFGTAIYRPDQAGYNDPKDVARLASYLAGVQPQHWTADDLRPLDGLTDDEERADELAFAREWFPTLAELYQRAQRDKHILIIENIY